MDEFTYLLSEYAGDDGVKAYVEKLIDIWQSVAKMQKFIHHTRLELELDKLRLGDNSKPVEGKGSPLPITN